MPPRRSLASKRDPSSTSLTPPPAASTSKPAKSPRAKKVKEEVDGDSNASPRRPRASKGKTKSYAESGTEEEEQEQLEPEPKPSSSTPKRRKSAKKVKTETAAVGEDGERAEQVNGNASDSAEAKPAKKPRVSKKDQWPPPDLHPDLHPPRAGHPAFEHPPLSVPPNGGIRPNNISLRPMLLGAHVSIGGGIATSLLRAGLAGANGLAMFVKNQRSWVSKPYEDEAVARFRELMRELGDGGAGYGPESILVHGSYLINLGNPDPQKWKVSYDCFKDDLERCNQLGIKLYNWHPGSTVGQCTREESYASIARAINQVHKEVPNVITVIENMANAGSNIIGTTFHDLASIIALVENKDRVRICLDTCHLFAAGYDIRTPAAYGETMRKFNEEVGNGYLAGIHMNDSKADLGAKKDLHENIGLGKIGLTAFRCIMRDPVMAGIPLILETPQVDKPLEAGELSLWTREIKLLYEIQGISDTDWPEKEVEIEKRWREERDRLNPPKPPKEKGAKGATKGKKGKKKGVEEEDEDDEEDEE